MPKLKIWEELNTPLVTYPDSSWLPCDWKHPNSNQIFQAFDLLLLSSCTTTHPWWINKLCLTYWRIFPTLHRLPAPIWWGHDTHAYDHVWCMVWRGKRPARVSKSIRRSEANSVRVPEVEAQSNSSSSLPRSPGPVCLKLVTQDTSGLRFRWSTNGWKANLITKPIQVVSHQKLFGIHRNCRNKLASTIYLCVASPYLVQWAVYRLWAR